MFPPGALGIAAPSARKKMFVPNLAALIVPYAMHVDVSTAVSTAVSAPYLRTIDAFSAERDA